MRTVFIFTLLLLWAPLAAGDTLAIVSNAWVRAAPPTVSMHAGYATLHNTGDKAITLIKVTSPQFGSVQMHKSFIENGMARMRHVNELTLKPGASLHFAPSGYHLMLMQAQEPIKMDSTITFVFYFSNGKQLQTTAPVLRSAAQQQPSHQHHHKE